MDCPDYKAPDAIQKSALAAVRPAVSDFLYQFAAVTVVIFMLATML